MVSLNDITGVWVLAMVVSFMLSFANSEEYKGMGVGKSIGLWLLLTVLLFIAGIGIYFGVVLIAS